MKRPTFIPQLLISLLVVSSFILALSLSARQSSSKIQRTSNSITAQLLGDSRRLFANHFYLKADEYFHKGYYPSIFDQAAAADNGAKPAMTMGAVGGNAHEGEVEWMEKPQDWIEWFSRHFFPSEHMHLDDGNHGDHDHDGDGTPDHAPAAHDESHDHDHDGDGVQDHAHEDHGSKDDSGSDVSEILPWLSIAAELNPDRPEIYVTGAYYLRDRLGQVDEAEAFLREGWRINRRSPAIVYELARIKEENRDRLDLARNLYRLAVRYWQETESEKEEPDEFLLMQILMHYALAEHRAGETGKAVQALKWLRTISPHPKGIDKLINEFGTPVPFVSP